jgi:ABC-type multidrug transport system fused ATPase/permease subunit
METLFTLYYTLFTINPIITVGIYIFVLIVTIYLAKYTYRQWLKPRSSVNIVFLSLLLYFWSTTIIQFVVSYRWELDRMIYCTAKLGYSTEKLERIFTEVFPHARHCFTFGIHTGTCADSAIRDRILELYPGQLPPPRNVGVYDFVQTANDHRLEFLRIDPQLAPYATYEIDSPRLEHIDQILRSSTPQRAFWIYVSQLYNFLNLDSYTFETTQVISKNGTTLGAIVMNYWHEEDDGIFMVLLAPGVIPLMAWYESDSRISFIIALFVPLVFLILSLYDHIWKKPSRKSQHVLK